MTTKNVQSKKYNVYDSIAGPGALRSPPPGPVGDERPQNSQIRQILHGLVARPAQ